MEFNSGCGRSEGVMVAMAILLVACLASALWVGSAIEDGMTARSKANASAKSAQAQYEYQAMRAQEDAATERVKIAEVQATQRRMNELVAELDKMRLAQANYEQRLSILTMALVNLDDDDDAELLRALDAHEPWLTGKLTALDWKLFALFAIITAVVSFLIGIVLASVNIDFNNLDWGE